MKAGVLLAAVNVDLPKQNRGFGPGSGLLMSDVLMILGVGLGLLLILSAIIYLWMRRRRNPRRHITGGQKVYRGHDHSKSDLDDVDEAAEEHDSSEHQHEHDESESGDDAHDKRRYKYRVRRRSHRSRNPTLSETGGLPPVKSPESGKPC